MSSYHHRAVAPRSIGQRRYGKAAALRALAVVAVLTAMAPAQAAPAVFSTNTTAVKLDGATLGTQTTGSGLRNTVVQDNNGLYHLWLLKNGGDSYISRMVHATSVDGINFATHGILQPPANYWAQPCGALAVPATEPIATFVRVSQVGGEWVMMVWHQNQAGQTWYSYNSSVWRLGPDPNNLTITPHGPLPTTTCGTPAAPGRFHIGAFGMAGSHIYLRHVPQAGALAGSLGGNLGRYGIGLGAPPPTTTPRPAADASLPKQTLEANLFTGTPFYEVASPVPPGATRALVYNAGRTLDSNGTLGTYYSFADYNTTAALEKDLWYVESADGGNSWNAPARIYGPLGPQVLVDGLPNGGNFSAPEVTRDGRSYFVTRDACNNAVMVTPASATDDPRLSVSTQFSPASIPAGQTAQLTVALRAPAGCNQAAATPIVSNLAFSGLLPTHLQFTGTVINNSCNGTITPTGSSLMLSGASLLAGQSCSAVLEVQGLAPGSYSYQIAAMTVTNDQNLPPAQDAQATLAVTQASAVAVPTLGSMALASLAIALAALGIHQGRRRGGQSKVRVW